MTGYDFYRVILFIVPLYTFMLIGYGSVKWWKVFNQEQCSGISRFCSLFAVPVLSFYYITRTDLFEMNLKFLGADVLQKVIVLLVLACWCKLAPRGSIEHLITIFSICTLPNTLILGLPIIKSMYHASALVVEIFLAQSVIWHPLLLIMYEYREARIVISQQFSNIHGCDVDTEATTPGGQSVAGEISYADTRDEKVEAIGAVHVGGGKAKDLEIHTHLEGHEPNREPSARNEQGEIEEVPPTSTTEVIPKTPYLRSSNRPTSMPSTSAMAKHVMIIVGKKLISNPNTYVTIIGLVWAFVLSMFHIAMPLIMTRSVTFLSNASLGMGMFNMGLLIGLQPTSIPCGKVVATLTMVLRFIIGPVVMAFASTVIGLRGTIFHIAVVQAALSQGVVPSIFAVEYNVYPEVFSSGMSLGMLLVLPVMFLYYNLLGGEKQPKPSPLLNRN